MRAGVAWPCAVAPVGAGVAWPAPEHRRGPTPAPPSAVPVSGGAPWPRSDTDAVGDAGPATRAARPAVSPATRPPDAPDVAVPGLDPAPHLDAPTFLHPGPVPASTFADTGPGPGSDAGPDTGLSPARVRPIGSAHPPPRSLPADPPTDHLGFPTVPPVRPAAVGPDTAVDPAEAAALAAAFAVDYLSWDEDDPARRGRVLLDYLSTPGPDPARLGWSGAGRQRAEFALPGRSRRDREGRLLVDVRVRITPYRAVGEHGPVVEHGPGEHGTPPTTPCVPAAAPAPTGRGWRSLASMWVRLSVPIVHDGRRAVVDAWEEITGAEPRGHDNLRDDGRPALPADEAGPDVAP